MLGTLKFRHRIVLLVVVAAAALVAVTTVTLVLGRRNERQITAVQTRYVPLLELERDLKGLYAQIPHLLEDAATAGEPALIGQADVLHDALVDRLSAGAATIRANGGDARALLDELAAYYGKARSISEAIARGTPGAELGAKIRVMQAAQQTFELALDRATTPDRDRLDAAFAAARASQRTALEADIAVAAAALVVMVLLSLRLIRRTVGALREVSLGMERLARGEFEREIDVTTPDELGDLAREANHTAAQLIAAHQALEDKAAELARASRYKSEFLANMSHELRTPLNSIMILSKILGDNEEGGLTAKQIEFASLIRRSGEELLALINDVLDLAKIEAGKQELEVQPVTVAELAAYARNMFEPLAVEKQLALEVEIAADAPATITSDRGRLSQILKNLLSNAFKFTDRGHVGVSFARAGDALAIAVSDTGIGIPEDKRQLIFEAFTQAETGTSRTYGGTGLGLTIARDLALRLGGELAVESEVGVGSTFRVVLPIEGPPRAAAEETPAAAATAPVAPVAPVRPVPAGPAGAEALVRRRRPSSRSPAPRGEVSAATRAALAGKEVLVVDDDMRTVYSLSNALRALGLRVLTAADGQEALDELAAHPGVDAVLMDVMMPNLDGNDATRRIREQPRFATLPVIALSAMAMPEERERCLAAGATTFVAKPVDTTELVEVVRAAIDQRAASAGRDADGPAGADGQRGTVT